MSQRVTSTPLFGGSHVVSLWGGLGIPGSAIPTTGDAGGSPLANDEIVSTSEYRLEVVTLPTAGTLQFFPDTSFQFSGAPDGTYSFEYEGFEDGISYGSVTDPLNVGVTNGTATGAPHSISLTPPAGAASSTTGSTSGTGTGTIAALSLTAPIGAASGTGAVVNGTGTGAIAAVGLIAPLGGASGTMTEGNGAAVGDFAALTLSAPAGSAVGIWSVGIVRHTKVGSITRH